MKEPWKYWYLVAADCGFTSGWFVNAAGYEAIVVDNLSTGSKNFLHSNAKLYVVDITSPDAIENVFLREKPDFVIHQAAQIDVATSIREPIKDATCNIMGSLNILQCCVRHSVKKIIYASSCAVYGETEDINITESSRITPISFYGLSKYIPERYIHLFHLQYGLPYMILRYANVYGPRQSVKGEGGVISIFIQKLLNQASPVIFGDGNQTRDFVFVKDVARANVLALQKGNNEILNISSNKKTSINQIFSLISSFLPLGTYPIYQDQKPGDIRFSQLDNKKANEILQWEPVYNLPTGITETIDFYRKNL